MEEGKFKVFRKLKHRHKAIIKGQEGKFGMENQCKNCLFENEIYQNDFIKLDDPEYNEILYCPAYRENGIPKDILNDEQKCIFKIDNKGKI